MMAAGSSFPADRIQRLGSMEGLCSALPLDLVCPEVTLSLLDERQLEDAGWSPILGCVSGAATWEARG